MPEGAGAAGAAAPAATATAAPPAEVDSLEPLRREYQALAQQLNPLQLAAMADSAIAARWAALNADLETRLRETSDFYNALLERRDEIEARLAAAGQEGGALSMAEQAELGRFYRNVQTELARARTTQIRGPEFADRFAAFRSSLFEKMRAMEPGKIEQLDRFERLDQLLFRPAQAESATEPGALPDPNAPGPG